MRKIIASLLAVVMVVCAFSTMSVSAAEGNLLANKPYTVTADLTANKADSGSMVTDGNYRGDGTNEFNGDSAVDGVSIEWFGTAKTVTYTFEFDAATDIGTIVFKSVRIASNRDFGTLIINGGTPIMSTEATKTAVAGAPLYGAEAPVDQYFDVSVDVELTDITTLTIMLMTNQYVCQYDEIEAYAPGSAPQPSEPSSEEPSSEEPSSEEPSSEEPSDVEPSESSEVDSSESSEEEVVVADPTYTATLTDNGDGTASLSIVLPDGIGNGKVVFAISENLTYVANSAATATGGALNDVMEGQITVSFASMSTFAEGTVALEADFDIAEGAELSEADINVPTWELGDGTFELSSNEDGDVIKVYVPFVEETSEEPSSEEPSSEEPSSEEPSSEEPSSEEPSSEEPSSVDSSVEDSSVEESSVDAPVVDDQPDTGDLGIAAFAVLAVISAGAVVVLKKRA